MPSSEVIPAELLKNIFSLLSWHWSKKFYFYSPGLSIGMSFLWESHGMGQHTSVFLMRQ